jgi:hypothetical protein
MMTHPAAAFFKVFGMGCMGKVDPGSPELAKDIFVGQDVVGFLGQRDLPPDGACRNQPKDDGQN